jgi:Fur family ferric uptake transcriptional regulator
MSQALKQVEEAVQANGLRLTTARQAILRTLASLPGPATITEIANQTDVDTATVYRNIVSLKAIGVIEEIALTGSASRFSLAHAHHHDHLVCTVCGMIAHIACTLPSAPLPSHDTFAKISHHEVTYYGICRTCSASL